MARPRRRFTGGLNPWYLAAALLVAASVASGQTEADRREWPKTDFSKRTVELAEIQSGGPPKDGIPAIDRPRYVSLVEARAWLKPKEPVLALRIGRTARAYPIQILIYHEIVNDTIDGRPVAVTFCPLCNAALVFDRRVGSSTLDFGTTGRLRYSDLVMYDRQTESWWQQFTGSGIVGHYAGTELRRFPSRIVAFEEFERAYPDGRVLSRKTGYARPYGRNPYAGYDRIDQSPFMFSGTVDKRLPPMERVLSVSISGRHRIYPLSLLEQVSVLNHTLDRTPYVVFVQRGVISPLDRPRAEDGRPIPAVTAFEREVEGRVLEFEARDARFRDRQSGSEWNMLGEAIAGPLKGKQLADVDSSVTFAFAWLAFRPDSEIVRALE
jgi:hypothetical protein